jgi:hypothetical protein
MRGDAKHLLLWAQVRTGMELDAGTPHLLDDAERARRGRQLEAEASELIESEPPSK